MAEVAVTDSGTTGVPSPQFTVICVTGVVLVTVNVTVTL
jgi:hypothetical protein